MTIVANLRQLDDSHGAVRVEDVYDTDIEDLWDACTDPTRLARWIAEVSGDLRPGGTFAGSFMSGFEGAGRIEVCERPTRLVLTTWADDAPDEQSTIEVALSEVDGRTRLVVEERGIPLTQATSYAAGWHVHVEDLATHVAGQERDQDPKRWSDAVAAYADAPIASA